MGEKLVVVGQGYVGLPLAMRAVSAGFDVVGIDLDEWRVKRLNAAESYVEDVDDDLLVAAHRSGRYLVGTDYADAEAFDVCVITVPTPLREGVPDLRHIGSAGESLAPLIRPGATVILESTTYPGTTEEYLRPLLEEGSGLCTPEDFFLGYSPERIDPGNPRWQLENTPKVVSGIDEASLERTREFYERIVRDVVPVSSLQVAELCKLLENTFRHVNIALVNELSIFAQQLGIDVWEAIDAASTKPFGYMRFTPGPGVGGHCLPIDPSYLSWKVKRSLGHNFRFVELANDINDHMPDHVVHRLILGLNQRRKAVKGSRVFLLGLAYKKNAGDCRESPAIEVAKVLGKLGADVRAADPHVDALMPPPGIEIVQPTAGELSQADAVVILTDHDCFDYEMIQRVSPFVFDTRDRCRGANVERL
ncbi:UDP-N-acetyl-D-mannosaminuronic acid dehydrogenase/UDP-N-acetyl-D-glucosamine dehydrogenase [Streptosporangium album]|uniref:UDP-N-acetyl-D-mannosaminuronic acid dehydrogenase/UDP-N-acetyl-D-glucosamine dehydrogenase n=1 Tax=Streptosporangium album TaxID=47479 RepID=A0A7W7RPI2_9ACTN|nr:nucleotide sugar dehydrogenase [Streptosporangium album]MBB4935751.1 UDP-N-acetyl-D-mannosaminuronic acid dehydrogenase/UDP-N-acetyl-D-glucosamine dehydrogenase [Streptosporangium album]